MAKMNFDEEGLLDEPCFSCEKAYVEDIWYEWCCDEKECPYKEGGTKMNENVTTPTQVTEITENLIQQVREEQDRFIFETIHPYIKEMTKMIVSKKILCRALQCFQEEHFEEYMALKKESEETWNL